MTVSTLSLQAYIERLSSGDATPGGGSASAAVGAMAAGLVRMVALLTANSPKFGDVAERATGIASAAETLRDRLVRCVHDDVAAFDDVSAAFRMPKGSEDEKAARTAAIQEALQRAADPPMIVVETSLEACKLAAELVDFGNPNAVSDVGCAAMFAASAAQGAALNVAINIKSLKDRTVAQRYAERLRLALAQVDLLSEVVLGKVDAAIRTG